MAASSQARGGVASKVVSIVPGNREIGLATIQGVAAWFDWTTRRPLLITDATALTALRTGALSAIATKALAPEWAATLAMIGAGGQALSLMEAVCLVRPITLVRIANRHREAAEALAVQLPGRLAGAVPPPRVEVCSDVASAVGEADVICVATTSTTPLLHAGEVAPGVHINAVGAYRPDMREVATSLFAAAQVVCVDEPEGALREAGDLIDAVRAGVLEPGSLVPLGRATRRVQEEGPSPTVFKSVGSAAADLAVLQLLAERSVGDESVYRLDLGD